MRYPNGLQKLWPSGLPPDILLWAKQTTAGSVREEKIRLGLSCVLFESAGVPATNKIPTTDEETQMKKILAAALFAALAGTFAFAATETLDGWVSDAKCGAKINADCAKKCADAGQPLVIVTSDKKVVPVANSDALKAHAGHHVTVTGTMADGKLTVTKVEMAKDQTLPK